MVHASVKTNARSRFCCLPIFKRCTVPSPVATILKTFNMTYCQPCSPCQCCGLNPSACLIVSPCRAACAIAECAVLKCFRFHHVAFRGSRKRPPKRACVLSHTLRRFPHIPTLQAERDTACSIQSLLFSHLHPFFGPMLHPVAVEPKLVGLTC